MPRPNLYILDIHCIHSTKWKTILGRAASITAFQQKHKHQLTVTGYKATAIVVHTILEFLVYDDWCEMDPRV